MKGVSVIIVFSWFSCITLDIVESSGSPFRLMFPEFKVVQASGKAGEALFLTPYIEAGKIEQAQKLARVTLPGSTRTSYSGYLTVNKKIQSNVFIWFFPALVNPKTSPVLLWLQGGPGGSSLFGIFVEHGPFSVGSDLKLHDRKYSWTSSHSVLYVDNPVGTGFSFTKEECGYARNQTDVARDLYIALLQFFTLFPSLQKNDFYVSGESYAGKYVPAISYKIHTENPSAKLKINLKGLAIGDGFCDPLTMQNYGDFLYGIGLIDENARAYFKKQSALAEMYIQKKQWLEALKVFDSELNGDLISYPSYFFNVTGFKYYFNYLLTEAPKEFDYYPKYVQQDTIRKAIHVGNVTFSDGIAVEKHLALDIMQSVKPWIETLLNNSYYVMFYNGQLDVIIGYPLTENFLNSLQWKGSQIYKNSPRYIWYVDGDVAGYVREANSTMIQVMVRNAGHIMPFDQPKLALDMITLFTSRHRGK